MHVDTRRLVENLGRLTYADLPSNAIAKTTALVLDFLGYTAAARDEPAHRALLQLMRYRDGPATATAIGHSFRLPSRDAALLNGASAHMRELDDTHRGTASHPGDSVIAAGLAAAEEMGASGEELIIAVIAGYDIAIRVGEALTPAHYRKGWHTSGTLNVFGAAMTAARLLGLDRGQSVHAIGLAGTQCAGSTAHRSTRGMAKDLNPGRAAEAGLLAAQLASLGFTGSDDFFENPLGLALYGDILEPEPLSGELTGPLRVLEVGQKPLPGCRFLHPAVEATCHLITDHSIRADEVLEVAVRIFALGAEFVDDSEPWANDGPYGPRFSAQYNIAYALTHGADVRGLFDDRHVAAQMDDLAFRRLVGRIDVHHDQDFQKTWPAENRTAVRIVTTRGVFDRTVALGKGEPENPLGEMELLEKFMMMTNQIYDAAQQDRICAMAFQLERSPDVRQLMSETRVTRGLDS